MVTSVSDVLDRLALIQSAIEGVVVAQSELPRAIASADMPLFLNFAGSADYDWDTFGADYVGISRVYTMRLYIMNIGQGTEYEAQSIAEPFMSRVRNAFGGRPLLDDLAYVQQATLLNDSGVTVLGYFGAEYLGVEWGLQVDMIVPRDYKEGN